VRRVIVAGAKSHFDIAAERTPPDRSSSAGLMLLIPNISIGGRAFQNEIERNAGNFSNSISKSSNRAARGGHEFYLEFPRERGFRVFQERLNESQSIENVVQALAGPIELVNATRIADGHELRFNAELPSGFPITNTDRVLANECRTDVKQAGIGNGRQVTAFRHPLESEAVARRAFLQECRCQVLLQMGNVEGEAAAKSSQR
jgi:hypothetical protein